MADSTRLTIIAELKDALTGPLRKIQKALDDMDRKAEQHGRNQVRRDRQRAASARVSAKDAEANAYRYSREKKIFDEKAKSEGYYYNKQRGWLKLNATRAAEAETRIKAYTRAQRAAAARTKDPLQAVAAERRIRAYTTATRASVRNPSADPKMTAKATAELRAHSKAMRDALPLADRFADRITKITARFTESQAKADRFGASISKLATTFGASTTKATAWGATMGRVFGNLPNQANKAATAVGAAMAKIYAHQDKFQSGLNKTYKWGVAAPAAVISAYAAKEGMARLNTFEGSAVRLGVLDFDEDQKAEFQKKTDEMVRGTMITLPDGMNIATKLLASIDPADFEDRMQTVIDSASVFSPDDVQGLATVFTQVQQKGFLTGEEANQFNERLVPVIKLLADDLNASDAEIREMMEKRQITADMVWEAVGPAVEGGAKAMGETFLGSWGMLKAAVGRSGQYFLEGMSQELEQILKLLTSTLDTLAPFFRNLGESLGIGLTGALEQVPKIGEALAILDAPLRALFSTFGDILPELVHGFANWLKIANLVVIPLIALTTVLLQLAEHTLPVLIPALLAFVHIIGYFLGLILVKKAVLGLGLAFRWLFKEMKLLPLIGKVFSEISILTGLKNIGAAVITWAKALPGQVGLAIYGAVRAIPAGLSLILQGIGTVLLGLGGRLKAMLGWFGRFTVVARATAVFTRLWAALGGGAGILTALKTGFLTLFNTLRVIPGIGWIITALTAVIALVMNWGRITDWVKAQWTGAVDAIQWKWATFKAWWVRLAEDIVAPFIALRDRIVAPFIAAREGVAKQWRELKAGTDRAVESVIAPFREGIFAPIRMAIIDPIRGGVEAAGQLWGDLKSGASGVLGFITAPFRTIGEEIFGFLDTFDGPAGAAILRFFAPFQAVVDWVTGLKDAIADFVDTAIAKLEALNNVWADNPLTKAAGWIQEKGSWLGDKLGLREKQDPTSVTDTAASAMAAGAANVNAAGGANTEAAARRASPTTAAEFIVPGARGAPAAPAAPGTPGTPGAPGAPGSRVLTGGLPGGYSSAVDGNDRMRLELNEHLVSNRHITQMSNLGVGMAQQVEWAKKGIYFEVYQAALDKGAKLTDDEIGAVLNVVRGGAAGDPAGYYSGKGVAPRGYFTGGYTGDYGTHEIAGVVHGREFVVNAAATKSLEAATPGAMAYINTHGALPAAPAPAGVTFSPSVHITVGNDTQAAEVAAVVRAELARQAATMRRQYMTPSARGAN